VLRTRWWTPWLFTLPALAVLVFFLIYPSLETVYLSFLDKHAQAFVGLANYVRVFTSGETLVAFRNNAIWLVFFTTLCVSFGLMLAVLLDRVRYEWLAKSVIFLPMAISMVGASVIWKFIYAYRPPGIPQIGLLNALVVRFGGQPQGWLVSRPWNNLSIVMVGVWIWTGFCMVVLSAAYKDIPRDVLESARIDGASEWQIFWRIVLPMMRSTILVVTTTMIVFVLKIFDIVYVMTNGNFDTEVLANRMYKMFQYPDLGQASTLAVILLLLILPIIFFHLRQARVRDEAST